MCADGGLPREGLKGERCRVQGRRLGGGNGRRQSAFLFSYGWDYLWFDYGRGVGWLFVCWWTGLLLAGDVGGGWSRVVGVVGLEVGGGMLEVRGVVIPRGELRSREILMAGD